MTERLYFHFSLSWIAEGNGNPFRCSCLENPRDGGAWWAAVYGVTQSRTGLKWLSCSNHKWVLNFVKGFFCICWDDRVVFIFQFVYMVYHIDCFAYIEESLHPWNKPNLIMVYELFNVFCLKILFARICWEFLHLCSSVILACSFFFCVVFVWFWYQGDGGLVEWVWVFLPLQFFERVLEG